KQQQLDDPPRNVEGNLYQPAHDEPRERGDYPGHVMERSLYTAASLHPWVTGMLLGAAGLAIAGLTTGGASRKRDRWIPAARR
ncbi:MAG: family NAD(P)-dependent oxidoreductase, partial [Phycisphaerales bacterium]|nr:family NAD(P)-dependent oxidoreductase [Phycisphaerales bacterium]